MAVQYYGGATVQSKCKDSAQGRPSIHFNEAPCNNSHIHISAKEKQVSAPTDDPLCFGHLYMQVAQQSKSESKSTDEMAGADIVQA